jgi:hypothetical protein
MATTSVTRAGRDVDTRAPHRHSSERRRRFPALISYGVLVLFAIIEMYPIFLMLANSLRSDLDILSNPLGLPTQPQFGNYVEIWERSNFPSYFMNSVYVTGVGLLVLLLISSMAAYYLARFNFRWNKPLLMVFLLGLTPFAIGWSTSGNDSTGHKTPASRPCARSSSMGDNSIWPMRTGPPVSRDMSAVPAASPAPALRPAIRIRLVSIPSSTPFSATHRSPA